MHCPSCRSAHYAEMAAEINIHFRGLENLDKPGVLLFPQVVVCLDCGFSRFTVPQEELAPLKRDRRKGESQGVLDDVAVRGGVVF